MKALNLGCGKHFSRTPEWTNINFASTGKGVIVHNLLEGIPCESNSFDFVYHSHLLEHFSREDGEKFIIECLRVLKPGGILRIVVPDLERIAKNYISLLEEGLQRPEDEKIRSNYEWMMLEMFDQTVRNSTGGKMSDFLSQENLPNEDFVYGRIGEEGRSIRKYLLSQQREGQAAIKKENTLLAKMKQKVKGYLLKKYNINLRMHEIGEFRLGGEIHQWMYDRYSLTYLLTSHAAIDIKVCDAFTSYLPSWSSYGLDGKEGITRKPDSLFLEGIKK